MLASAPPADRTFRALQPAAEAARYALLRRLAPSMRHHLVVNLQPIGMIYEVMTRRLQAPAPDLGQVQEGASKINGFARSALASCIDVVGWLAPDESVPIGVAEGVRECASLLATSLGFRGFALRNETAGLGGQVRRSAIRNVLTAALVHATDASRPPAELVISGVAGCDGVTLVLDLRGTEGGSGFTNEAGYRLLTWADVQALAASEDASLAREGQRFTLFLPAAPAA